MRVNVYAEEMTDRIEIISKEIDGRTFTGLRFYLYLPASYHANPQSGEVTPACAYDRQEAQQLKAPFIHRPGDDDSAAVTFWGKRDLRVLLRHALTELDLHYAEHPTTPAGAKERGDG